MATLQSTQGGVGSHPPKRRPISWLLNQICVAFQTIPNDFDYLKDVRAFESLSPYPNDCCGQLTHPDTIINGHIHT